MLEEFTKNLDEEEREEAVRNRATGFNNFDAANEIHIDMSERKGKKRFTRFK